MSASQTTSSSTFKTTRREPVEDGEVHDMGSIDERSTSSNAPEMVKADMDGGLESVSVKLAKAFYERYGTSLHGMTKRGQLSQFYIDTYESWCPEELTGQPRHFKQILYALVNDGKVVRVVGGGRFLRWAYVNRRSGGRAPRRDNRRRSDSHGSDSRDRRDDRQYQTAGRRNRRFNGRRDDRRDHRVSDDLVDRIAARLAERESGSDRR